LKLIALITFLCCSDIRKSYSQQIRSENEHNYQLNHIDLCVDSITFTNLLHNRFIADSFAFVKKWSDSTGAEILILGQQSFIHVFPEKGFYKDKNGASLLIHHSFRWKETNEHLEYLQNKSGVSLYVRPYHSAQTHIDYINIKEPGPVQLIKAGASLQNPSKQDYYSYGYNDSDLVNGISQEKYMNDYVAKETATKLFQNITAITLSVTETENNYLLKLLDAYGYQKMKNFYVLNKSAVVLKRYKPGNRNLHVELKLSAETRPQTIVVSENFTLVISGTMAILKYKVAE
jgi:hypothetical protein